MSKKQTQKQFGDRVREAREARGLKVAQLERLIPGLTDQAITNIERGADPRFSTVRKLAYELGICLSEFNLGKIPEK